MIQRDRAYLLVAAALPVFDFFGFLNGFQHFHCVQLLLCRHFTVKTNLNVERQRMKKCVTQFGKKQQESIVLIAIAEVASTVAEVLVVTVISSLEKQHGGVGCLPVQY